MLQSFLFSFGEPQNLNSLRKDELSIHTLLGYIANQAVTCKDLSEPLDNLKTLVIAIIGAVGVIILAKNVMEFAQAYQQQDSSTMNSALKGIVAGIMMAGISSVLNFDIAHTFRGAVVNISTYTDNYVNPLDMDVWNLDLNDT